MPPPRPFLNRLANKVALITGAGSPEGGIGRAIALLMAGEGASVALVDRDEGRMREVAGLVEEAGGAALALTGDVSRPADRARMVGAAADHFGRIDILVNNVGVSRTATSLIDLDLDAWSETIDVNLKSAVAMSALVVPLMKAAGGGAIVNIASIAGVQSYANAAYGPSKAALIAFTRETAAMHGRDGIRANAVAPGHVFTPHVGAAMPPALRAARRDVAPLAREGDAWDVAEAALFLASDASRFITGALLPVDGGVTAIGPMLGHGLIEQGSGD